jgi:hypothetical protein
MQTPPTPPPPPPAKNKTKRTARHAFLPLADNAGEHHIFIKNELSTILDFLSKRTII